jgi:hypothetical protein
VLVVSCIATVGLALVSVLRDTEGGTRHRECKSPPCGLLVWLLLYGFCSVCQSGQLLVLVTIPSSSKLTFSLNLW